MFTTLYRIIKYGFQGFARNYLVSIATVLVMLLAVIVFESLVLFGAMGKTAVDLIQNKIDISAEFSDNAREDEMLQLKSTLEQMKEIRQVEYISKDEALKRFKDKHTDSSDLSKSITQALQEIDTNPLRASLNIRAYDPKDYAAIAAYLNNDSLKNIVSNVSYNENQVVIDRLIKAVDVGKQAGFILTVILAVVAIVVSFNTILLAIYSNKDEIAIMRLVGGSNAFVRGPYIVIGVLYGMIAAILGVLIMMPFAYISSPYVRVVIPDMDLWGYVTSNAFLLLEWNMIFAVTIGVLSSVIVVKRYLRG